MVLASPEMFRSAPKLVGGGWLIDLQMLEADISNYISNGEWDLVGKLTCLNFYQYSNFQKQNPNM